MESATYVACIACLSETLWRFQQCYVAVPNNNNSNNNDINNASFTSGFVYFGAYILCIVAVFLDLKQYSFFKQPILRKFLSFLHAMDGIVALILGLAYYYKSQLILYIGVLAITKCFLLHLLSRMVTGEAAFGPYAISLQTTKTFIHHTGSFLFLGHDTTAIIAGCWRFVSMNGHAAMTLRDSLDASTYDRLMWLITHARNTVLVLVILTCFLDPDIRRGFGKFCLP